MIQHIVLFRPKAEVDAEQLTVFADAFERACREIPSVVRAAVGRDAKLAVDYAGEFSAARYPYSAVIEFTDRKGLFAYLTHPLHLTLGRQFWQTCESTIILDVEVVDAKTESLTTFVTVR